MKYISMIICVIAVLVSIYTLKLSKELIVSTNAIVKSAIEHSDHQFKNGYRMGVQMIAGRVTSESFIKDAGKFPNVVKLKNIIPDKCDILFRFKDGVQACISKPEFGDKNERKSEGEPGGKTK